MKQLVTLFDTTSDLATAVEDLLEATHTLEATWDVLGDESAYAWMSEEEAVVQWELDLRGAIQEEQWVLGYMEEVQKLVGKVIADWVKVCTPTLLTVSR